MKCYASLHKVVIWIGCAAWSLALVAQKDASPGNWDDIFVDRLSSDQGLSQVTVLAVLQDRKGFIWLGTQNGLNRYDGYGMKVYANNPEDSLSISGNFIYSLYEDQQGYLWIGTRDNGLNRFDPKTETFKHYVNDPADSTSLSSNFVHSILVDSKGIIWVGTWGGGLNAIDPKTNKITHYKNNPNDPKSIAGNIVTSLWEDRTGTLWIGYYGSGLDRMTPDRKSIQHFIHSETDPNSIGNNRIFSIYEDPSENGKILWIGTIDGGLNRLDIETLAFRKYLPEPGNPYSIGSKRIFDICVNPKEPNILWISTWDAGLCRMDKRSERFWNYPNQPDNPHSISANMLFSIIADHTGQIWAGSQGGGVNRINNEKQAFRHWNKNTAPPYQLSGNEISAVGSDKSGKLWISTTNNGLNIIDLKVKKNVLYTSLPGTVENLTQQEANVILEDFSGTLWIGLSGIGLYYKKQGTAVFKKYPLKGKNVPDPDRVDILRIFEDKDDQLWVGTLNQGMYLLHPQKETFTHYYYDPAVPDGISGNEVYAINQDKKGRLWLGMRTSGLLQFNTNTRKFITYKCDPKRYDALSSNAVNAVHVSSRYPGLLILGTAAGINLLPLDQPGLNDPSKVQFQHFGRKEGLLDGTVYGISEDNSGVFWISTNNGMYAFAIKKEGTRYVITSARHYDKSDGLLFNEFNLGVGCKGADGQIYFGGVGGLVSFQPEQISQQSLTAPVVFTLFDKYQTTGEHTNVLSIPGISTLKKIILSYKENIFSVEFSALNFKNPSKNKYAYQLEGNSDQWIELGERRRLTFANLFPGSYTLRVRYSYNNGPWSEDTADLQIVIRPPWWRSKLAWATYGLLLLFAIGFLRRYERNRMKVKHDLKLQESRVEQFKELDRMKSDFFANISHEFRTPLTLILGPVEQLLSGKFFSNPRQEYSLIKNNALRLQKLIDQLLDLSKLDAGKMRLNKRRGDLISLVRKVIDVFYSFSEKRRITLHFEADYPELIFNFDPELIENISFNLLSNAYKYTPEGGQIWVRIKPEGKAEKDDHALVNIQIEDTGRGIPAADLPYVFDRFYKTESQGEQSGTGIGLSLVKELVELHGGTVAVRSEWGKGTIFDILIPIDTVVILETKGEVDYKMLQNPEIWLEESIELDADRQAHTTTSPLILLVEDNIEMSNYIKRQLIDNYQVITALNGKEALDLIWENIPDLIISDLMMPEMNGYELTKRVKNDERSSHIPVIILTAKSSGGSRIEGFQVGADDYLVKPFDAFELKVRISNLIQQRQQLRQLLGNSVAQRTGRQLLSSIDAAFMEKLLAVIDEHLADEKFDVDQLARKAGMSRAQLYRKVKALTDQSVSEYIQTIRLKRAGELIVQQAGSLTEIAYEVGFKDPSYFSKCFRKQFGCLPSEFLERENQESYQK